MASLVGFSLSCRYKCPKSKMYIKKGGFGMKGIY